MIRYFYYHKGTKDPISACPGCGNNLRNPAEVIIYLTVAGHDLEIDSRLDETGMLKDTEDNAVANGYHAGTVCAGCGHFLFEVADEVAEEY